MPAHAQDFTTGQILGTVKDNNGDPVRDITVFLRNPQTGYESQSTTDDDGVFRFSRLPIANYTASVETQGQSAEETIRVQAGTVQSINFVVSTEVVALDQMQVTAIRAISTRKNPLSQEGGITVDTDDLVARVPLGRDITDIALLAPGAVPGDSAFGNLPSFGGASVAENVIYVNGYNTTDLRNFLGQMNEVPFEFYQQVDVKTGGFQAEFGRATGGVINLVTRRGTNDFELGANAFYTPDGLQSDDTPDTTDIFRSLDRETTREINVWGSGALIKDRLFFYALGNFNDNEMDNFGNSSLESRNDDDPTWGVNIDGVLWDDQKFGYHTVTYTHIDDRRTITNQLFAFDRETETTGELSSTETIERGGDTDIVKYTGVVRDWLTLSGLYGNSKARFDIASDVSDFPTIFDLRSGTTVRLGRNLGAQIITPIDKDERTNWRLDADIYVDNVFGTHRFRMGYDRERRQSSETSAFAGDQRFVIFADGSGLERFDPTGQFANTEVVRVDERTTGGNFTSILEAFYLQDQWTTPIDRLTFNLGGRLEDMVNSNVNGNPFVSFNNMIDYRTGFTYELGADRRSRVYGFVGTTHLPVAQNTNVRLAGEEIFEESFFVLEGITADASQIPITGEFIGIDVVSPGGVQDARTLVDQDLSAQKNQEFILGYDMAVADHWFVGARAVVQDLRNGLEDSAVDRGMRNFAIDNGLDVDAVASVFSGFHQFILLNPGSGATFFVPTGDLADDFISFVGGDPDGDGLVPVSLTGEQLGLPKVSRNYRALELTVEREYVDGWSLQGSYIISRLDGNTEGGIKSDIGQDDTGLTQDFDTAGLTDGTDGRLPNDRRHVLKLFGSYDITNELSVGLNFTAASGRAFGCLGVHPNDEIAAQFGASSFFCKLDENNRPNSNVDSRFTPRGSVAETEWTKQLDLSINYYPDTKELLGGAKVNIRVDIFNVFNTHDVTDINELGEFGSGAIRPTFGDPTGFIQPRTVRLSARIEL
ncbi:MAG: carboxypeptidase regulatory-like domain-containing protein [Gammaproteobacteria bacterium]|nr:carboxypeptidase regulatory-like domain-containing protein [Gammaproteobacteria bacterium]